MITLALNPSAKEFEDKHLPMSDAPEVQWKSQISYFKDNPYRLWFDKAELILKAASQGKCSYGGVMGDGHKCIHLDLSPLPTAGNFDKTYDGFKAGQGQEKRVRALQLLEEDSKHILVPTLCNLHKYSNTRKILICGYCPLASGSRTMKEYWKKATHKITVDITGNESGVAWGFGEWKLESGEVFDVGFMSKGPSSMAKLDDLIKAANALAHNLCLRR